MTIDFKPFQHYNTCLKCNVTAFQIGPHSAEKLKELSQIPDSTQERLKSFNGKYINPATEKSAIPMLNSVPDAAFFEAFAHAGILYWGVDQEFIFAVLFWDDMVESK